MATRPPGPPARRSTEAASELEALGACTHCGRAVEGKPNRCPHCKRVMGEAAHDLKRVAAAERKTMARQKNTADALFLVGLLVGGPLLSLGGRVRVGLFVLLGGAAASVLYRYAKSSLPAALLIGGLGAAVVAVAVTGPALSADAVQVGEDARTAYIAALARDLEPSGGIAEARGPGLIVAWFQPSPEETVPCGEYPGPQVRAHMVELGFARIVIGNQTEANVLCSFKP